MYIFGGKVSSDRESFRCKINIYYSHSVTKTFFFQKNREEPQFIGCQHHLIDRVLRIIMDEELGGNNTSPNIEYPFIPDL